MDYKLPFQDQELWEHLRSNSYLSEKYKLLYVATPKVACTSLKWWFASLAGLSKEDFSDVESDESDPDLVIHDAFRTLAPSVTGLQPQSLIEPLTSNSYFRFAVVRNPYTRIFSAWQSKLLLREPLQSHSFVDCDFYNRPIKTEEDIALAYEGFLEHILSLDEAHLDAHWKPQFNLLRPDLISYSKVAKLEHVNDLTAEFTRHVDASIPKPFRDRPRNESLIPYSRKFVTDRSVEIIQELYAKDFEAFGYDVAPVVGREDFSAPELNVAIRAIELIRGRHQRLAQISNQSRLRVAEAVKRRNEQIADLQNKLSGAHGELNELRNGLAAVYASRSWKITRPLRVAHRVLANRRQLVGSLVSGPKTLARSVRHNGFVGTLKKVVDKVRLRGRYSSVPRSGTLRIREKLDHSPKKLTLISMIKNEKNIIETFAAHGLAMFDRVIFVDHRSTDGTGAYLRSLAEAHPQVEYFKFDEAGYYQSEVMTWIVKNIVGPVYDGWIFFLDADEYLPFLSRTEFEEELAKYASFPLISMPWLNLVPVNMETDQVKGGVFLKPPKTAIHHKIAFQPGFIPFDEYVVAQGNHALLIGDLHQQIFPAEEAFPIYHLPIRTKQQLRDKIQHGVEAYKKMGGDRGSNLGFHWDEISRLIEQKGLAYELMADMVARYGEPLVPPYGKSIKIMIQEGYAEMTLNICTAERVVHFEESMVDEDINSSQLAGTSSQENITSKRGFPIMLDGDRHVLRFVTDI